MQHFPMELRFGDEKYPQLHMGELLFRVGYGINYGVKTTLGPYLVIFCFPSENCKNKVWAGGSLPLSIILLVPKIS